MSIRTKCAIRALEDVCQWLETGGEVAVFDATNSTKERRELIHSIVVKKMNYKLFFVESICDDPSIIEQNIMEVKISSPDYVNMNMDVALKDFLLRIEHYQDRYEPLDDRKEDPLSFIKIVNTGEKVVVHKHEGHIQSRIVYYLMNIHITPRTIYFTRVIDWGRYYITYNIFICMLSMNVTSKSLSRVNVNWISDSVVTVLLGTS